MLPSTESAGSTLAPLAVRDYRRIWAALLVGHIGTWAHDVAVGWYMADITDSALWVAAAQAATSLPIVLLALVAGTLADLVDRRRYLVAVQLCSFAAAGSLAAVATVGELTAATLLGFATLLGTSAAMGMPAQSALTPDLVPKSLLPQAAALHSVSMNLARSTGPAVGGALVGAFGPASAFAFNAATFLIVAFTLLRWRQKPIEKATQRESFARALRLAARYPLRAPAFRGVLVRSLGFFACASALTALLPLLVHRQFGGSATTLGTLLASIGIGAVIGAAVLPSLRTKLARDHLIAASAVGISICMCLLATKLPLPAVYIVLGLHGLLWISALSSFQVAAQLVLPSWVRARALALYITTFSLGMASGALIWGSLAQYAGISAAFYAAAFSTCVVAFATRGYRLSTAESLDTAPSNHWHAPPHVEGSLDSSPAMVAITYRVAPDRREAFMRLMDDLGVTRRRDGADTWHLMEEVETPNTFLEVFTLPSWSEHLRQHQRVTREEARVQGWIRECLEGGEPMRVRHYIKRLAPI